MKLVDLINKHFDGDDAKAAEAASSTLQTIRNWKSSDREVMKLSDGTFVLKSSKSIIFKI